MMYVAMERVAKDRGPEKLDPENERAFDVDPVAADHDREVRPSPGMRNTAAEVYGVGRKLPSSRPERAGRGNYAAKVMAGVRSEGAPLPSALRERLETAFAYPLDGVRVHTDAAAHEAAAALGAQAFTVGSRVAFRQGMFAPDDPGRLWVLVHELAHVVQQRNGSDAGAARDGEVDPDAERHADAAADAFLSGNAIPASPMTVARVACYAGPVPTTAPIVRAPIGNQNAAGEPGLGSSPRANIEKGASARRVGLRVEIEKAMRERPRLSLELGGSAHDFVTELPDAEYTLEGKRFHYTPRVFHVLNAIIHDVFLAKTPDELATLHYFYLADLHTLPPREYEDRDGKKYPFEYATPTGAAVAQMGLVNLEGAPDADGVVRNGVFLLAVAKRAEQIPAFAKFGPDTSTSTETATQADPATTTQTDQALGTEQESNKRKRPVPTLHLPAAKAPHLGLYQGMAREGRLIHDVGYDRDQPEPPRQRERWRNEMSPYAADGMALGYYQEGMGLTDNEEDRVLIPDWSRSRLDVSMQVDHVIELQLTLPGDREWADSMANYELLDKATNEGCGGRLRHRIQKERADLAAETGDPSWLKRQLVFEQVVADGGGSAGERWTRESIRSGDHIEVLKQQVGLAPRPDDEAGK